MKNEIREKEPIRLPDPVRRRLIEVVVYLFLTERAQLRPGYQNRLDIFVRPNIFNPVIFITWLILMAAAILVVHTRFRDIVLYFRSFWNWDLLTTVDPKSYKKRKATIDHIM
jgi:hypothetical protein